MRAAANHLASVTLELGGKSPTIIDKSANIETAARRITWGKFMNNGQVCLAPDYVFVHKSIKTKFLKRVSHYLDLFYTSDASNERSYARMVNNKHHQRVSSYIQDALEKEAEVVYGGEVVADQNYISPTVMTNVSMDSKLMTEEIFGPVLPVHSFESIDEVIQVVNKKEKPLALYIYSKNKKNIKKIINNTRSGGVCINHNVVHIFNKDLPFGGANNSGIGKANGRFGFEEFSNARGVLTQHVSNATELLMPPFTKNKQKIIDFTIKYF